MAQVVPDDDLPNFRAVPLDDLPGAARPEPKKRDRGLIEDVKDIGTALVEGVPSLGRRLKAAGQAVIGDLTGVEATAKAELEAATTSNAGALATFKEDLAQRRQSSDGSWSQAAKNVGGAIAETPAALPQLVAEQAPNAAVTLGAGAAGFKAGMVAAPFLGPLAPLGPIAGGLLGLWLGNTAVETGGKAIEKAEGGFTPTERGETLREGAVKGAVLTGVDAITFGATKLLYSPVGKAMEKAGTDALVRSGVDVTARESVEAALKDTAIRESVEAAQIAALKQANAGGRGVARGTGAFGLQTVGEGAGEGFGEYAATGQVDPTDVLLESVAGAGQSAIEIGIAKSGRGARGLIDGARTPPPDPDAELNRALDRVESARNEVFLGTSDGKETIANIVAAPDLGAAIDAAEASVPSMADLLQQKRTTAAERVAQELGIEPAANFPTAEQIIGGAPIPGIDVGPAGDSTRPSVFDQSAGTPGLQPGETRILTQPSVFAEPSAGTPGLQPGETRVLTQPSVFEAPSAEAGQARLATLRAGVDRDAELLAQRDGTPAAQPPEQMLRNAQRLEESARLIESNPRAPEAVLQRAQALREQAQSLRVRAEEIAASAPAEQAGAMTQFEREQIDAQRQVNMDKRLPTRGEQPTATIVDSTPMTQVQAQQRLAVVQDQSGQPLSFQIVAHPTQSGAFAIAQRPMPAAADLEMTNPAPAQVSAAEAQNRIESAELGGREQQRKRLDEARQIVVTRALKNVEERGGVASPQEAQIFQEAGLGKPYDSIDESLAPKPGLVLPRMEMAGPKTTQAGIELGTAGTFGTQARLERGANVPKDKGPLPDTTNVNLAGQVGATEQQNETLLGEPRDPGTELAKARAAAGYDATLAQAPRPKSVNGQPVAGLSNEQLQAIAANAALPNVVRRGASIEIAHRAAELPTSGKLKFSEQRTDAAPEATQQGKPVSSLGNITTVDPTTLPSQSRAQSGAMSRQTHRMVSLLGSMYGKKVVVFDSDNDAAPDGFVRRGDSRTIYLNRKSEISHLVVFGHELLHQLKADNAGAYDALSKVIKIKAGKDLNVVGIRGDMEELTADVVGNRFRETEFWQDVFREILASGKDTKVSQRSAMKLGASVVRAVDRMVKALKGMTGFNTDDMVENLGEVKAAVTKALASYAQEKRGEATELIREQVNASRQESQQGSVQQERGSGNESGRAAEAGPGNRVLGAAQGEGPEDQAGQGVAASEKRVPDTPEFRTWTGGNPVVTMAQANKHEFRTGEPVVVEGLHGTRRNFDRVSTGEASGGYFLSNKPVVSDEYAGILEGRGSEVVPFGGNVQRQYVRMDNPLVINARGASFNRIDTRAVPGFPLQMSNTDMINQWARQQGYDGVIYKDLRDSVSKPDGRNATPSMVYGTFKPTYVKSAIGNSGAYSLENESFLASEKRILLNIGLSTKEVKGGGLLTEDVVLSALAKLGLKVDSMPVHPSDTELTAVPAIDRPLTQEEGDDLSARLNQEAIVQRMPDGSGMLFGPKADEWGPYNPAYFVMADGKYAIEYEIQASAKRRKTQEAGVEVPTTVDRAADSTAAFRRARGKVFDTNRELKTEIQDAVRAAAEDAGVDLSTFSAETEKYLVRIATAEAVKALRENANAIGWYREKVTKALRIAALKHPELNTDPESRMVFIWALAVTSNGMRVKKNFELADKAYSGWKRYKKFPTNIGQGTAKKAINNGLRAYNVLSKKMTFDQLHNAMLTKSPVAQIGKLLGIKPSGEYADTVVYGSAILGPKVGNGFFANLYGHYEQLTIDRWLMRTWGRWTGTLVEVKTDVVAKKADTLSALLDLLTAEQRTQLEQAIGRTVYLDDLEPTAAAISAATTKESVRDALDEVGPLDKDMRARLVEILGKEKANSKRVSLGDEIRKAGIGLYQAIDGQVEAPRDPQQRNDMRKVFDQVLTELQKNNPGLTMSDLQAVLWYPEKRIYDAAKTDKETDDGYEDGAAPDYANAAAEHYRGRGVAKSAIDRVIAQVDAELQAADGAGRGGRSAGGVAQQPGGVSDPSVAASEKREVASLFKSLQESRGLGRVRALERVDAHPLGATIRQIDADFLDILDRLDTAGLVKINCK